MTPKPTPTQPAADRPTREDIETLIEAAHLKLAQCAKVQKKVIAACWHTESRKRQRADSNLAQAEKDYALARSLLATHGYEVKP